MSGVLSNLTLSIHQFIVSYGIEGVIGVGSALVICLAVIKIAYRK